MHKGFFLTLWSEVHCCQVSLVSWFSTWEKIILTQLKCYSILFKFLWQNYLPWHCCNSLNLWNYLLISRRQYITQHWHSQGQQPAVKTVYVICKINGHLALSHFWVVLKMRWTEKNAADKTVEKVEIFILFGFCVSLSLCFQLGCLEISTACLKMYFEGNPPPNQFLCRAYLCQGQLKSPPAAGSVVRTVNWTHILKGVVRVCVSVPMRCIHTYTIIVEKYCTYLH